MADRLVSIVTPMYNGADFIKESLESVIAQTYKNWEMIVVDDCSQDQGAGASIIKKYMSDDSRIRLISLNCNKGSSGARNHGIITARGDVLAFLDSDDLWSKYYLERQLEFMKRQNACIIFSSYQRIDEKTSEEILTPFIVPEKVNYKNILKSLPIFTSAAIVDINKVGKVYFNEKLGSLRDDWEFWLDLLRNDVEYAYGNREILASYRLRKSSVTFNKLKVMFPHWKILREVEKLSIPKSIYCFFCWAYTGLWKYSR